ncbi:hypothetical protein PTI98_006806, partial [Pleurotus ostreatus]
AGGQEFRSLEFFASPHKPRFDQHVTEGQATIATLRFRTYIPPPIALLRPQCR